ncbi:MAG TPA: hypothetical protein VGA85_00365 [Dehalococcoidales bacterium]
MKGIVKSVAVVGQVLGLLVGNKFTTPINYVLEQYAGISLL